MPRCLRLMILGIAVLIAACAPVCARPIVWARAADVLTLDPHAQNDNFAQALYHQIYEPLLIRDGQGKIQPALAESWELTADPAVWEFHLRSQVRFHDGSAFSADDVVFSLNRARQPASEMRLLLASVESVTRVSELTVRIKTRGANPLLPWTLTNVFIMSKAWAEKNKSTRVQDLRTPETTFASTNANGTGPYMLAQRIAGDRTKLVRNDNYWGKGQVPLEIEEIEYRAIASDDERVAAYKAGTIDLMQDVPVQAIQALAATPGTIVNEGAENRTIFLGMNVAAAAQPAAPAAPGAAPIKPAAEPAGNPFAQKAVRQAINMAIDRQAIQRDIMKGHAIPTGTIAPPMINGYVKQLDRIPPLDLAKARDLLASAGFPDGFTVTLNCPQGRYVNDAGICQAIAVQLGRIGITVNVSVLDRMQHLALIQKQPPQTDFFLMGFSVPTLDSEYELQQLFHTRTARAGQFNATRYYNPDVDRMIDGLPQETDLGRRNQVLGQIWRIVHDELIYVPLHVQTLAYVMKSDLDVLVDIENQPKLKFAKFRKQQG